MSIPTGPHVPGQGRWLGSVDERQARRYNPAMTRLAGLTWTAAALWILVACQPAGAHERFPQVLQATVVESAAGSIPTDVSPAAGPAPILRTEGPRRPVPAVLLDLVVVGLLLVGRVPRRKLIALSAVLFLTVLSYEIGVHSVHHVSDPAGEASCSALPASNASAVTIDTSGLLAFRPVALGSVPVRVETVRADHSSGPHCGRGPPISPSA